MFLGAGIIFTLLAFLPEQSEWMIFQAAVWVSVLSAILISSSNCLLSAAASSFRSHGGGGVVSFFGSIFFWITGMYSVEFIFVSSLLFPGWYPFLVQILLLPCLKVFFLKVNLLSLCSLDCRRSTFDVLREICLIAPAVKNLFILYQGPAASFLQF